VNVREHLENISYGAVTASVHLTLDDAHHVLVSVLAGLATATTVGLLRILARRYAPEWAKGPGSREEDKRPPPR
jgi:hypothetical protein